MSEHKKSGLIVAFKKDYEEDYVKKVIEAIRLIDGVAEVEVIGEISRHDQWIIQSRIKTNLYQSIWGLISQA